VHANAFDRYQAVDSPVHRLDPRAKVVIALLFVASNLMIPDGAWLAMGAALALVVAATVLAGLGPTFALRRSVVVLPFTVVAITVAFTVPGTAMASWSVGPWTLEPTEAGLIRFASIVCRSLLSVMAVILLTATTTVPDIAHALRHLRVPGALVATVTFAYRYLFVLSDEALRLMRARDARSAHRAGAKSGGTLVWRGRVAGHMAGQLFVRSLDRAERVHQAMTARGYAGHLMTMHPHEMRDTDWLAAAAALLAVVLIQVVGRLGFG
jgi:cobalt/nickel transport system permease protein